MIFFFKQKTAYEMRISDWSSDVCSSDLSRRWRCRRRVLARCPFRAGTGPADGVVPDVVPAPAEPESRDIRDHSGLSGIQGHGPERKSVVWGKSVSVRVDLGGRRIIKKKKINGVEDNATKYRWIHE